MPESWQTRLERWRFNIFPAYRGTGGGGGKEEGQGMNTIKAVCVFLQTVAMTLGPMLAYAGPQPSRLISASNSPGGTVSGYQPESAQAERESVAKLVSEIRRADYEGAA